MGIAILFLGLIYLVLFIIAQNNINTKEKKLKEKGLDKKFYTKPSFGCFTWQIVFIVFMLAFFLPVFLLSVFDLTIDFELSDILKIAVIVSLIIGILSIIISLITRTEKYKTIIAEYGKEKQEQERLQKLEKERQEKKRLETEKLKKEKLKRQEEEITRREEERAKHEEERLKFEAKRLERERKKKERLEAERQEKEKLEEIKQEAIAVLMRLGYKKKESVEKISRVIEQYDNIAEIKLEDLIKKAL